MTNLGKAIPAGILFGLFLLIGCSRLPAYGQPRVEAGDPFLSFPGLTYKNLTAADFRAPALPDDLRGHDHELYAHTSVAIRTLPGTGYVISSTGDRKMWCGHVETLVFQALMIPEKSWWNPTLARDKEAYVLQHEQIHFALMEISARQLNRRSEKEADQLTACEPDSKAVARRLSATIDRWMAESQEETHQRHEAFDQATSRLYAPKVQQWWFDQAMEELSDLAEWQ